MNRKRWLWATTILVLVAVVAGAAMAVAFWMRTSADGSVQVGTPQTDVDLEPTQPVVVRTSYFVTSLPAGFSIKTQAEPRDDPNALLRLVALGGDSKSITFAATLGNLPVGSITELGDYILRARTPDTYRPYSPTDMPSGAAAFQTVGGSHAFVVFWPHNGRYTELALTSAGGDSYEQLSNVFSYVMQHWNWQ